MSDQKFIFYHDKNKPYPFSMTVIKIWMVKKRSSFWWHLNIEQPNRLNTRQMDSILSFYVLVWYSNGRSSTWDIAIWNPNFKIFSKGIFAAGIFGMCSTLPTFSLSAHFAFLDLDRACLIFPWFCFLSNTRRNQQPSRIFPAQPRNCWLIPQKIWHVEC